MNFGDFRDGFNKIAQKFHDASSGLKRNLRLAATVATLPVVFAGMVVKEKLFPSFESSIVDGDVQAVEAALKKTPHLARLTLEGGERSLPLYLAASYKQAAVAEMLLQYGARLDVQDGRGITPLLVAAAAGDVATLRVFIAHQDPTLNKLVYGETETAIMAAAEGGHFDAMTLLHKNGARLDITTAHGQSALSQTRQKLSFIEKNYSADAKLFGLRQCAAYLETHVSELMSDANKDKNVYTPVMHACREGDVELATLLLNNDRHDSVNKKFSEDARAVPVHGIDETKRVVTTALKEAVDSRKPELVALVLQHGAKQDINYEGDKTPLMQAVRFRSADIAAQLLANDTSTINQLHLQKYDGFLSPKRVDFTHSALTYAVQAKDIKSVELLLQHGARTDLATTKSPLQLAEAAGLDDIAALIKAHAEMQPKVHHIRKPKR